MLNPAETLETLNGNGHTASTAPESLAFTPATSGLYALDVPAEHDRLNRRRDDHGNRLPWFFYFSWPWVEDVPLEESRLKRELELIGERQPITAAHLAHEYDEKLRPAYRRFREVLAEEEARKAAFNDWVSSLNREVDREIEELRLKREEALRPWVEEREARAQVLADAHRVAQGKVALAGGLYRPENPCEEDALLVGRRSLAEIAREEQMPDVQHDREDLLPAWLSWGMTILVGAMVGTSLGVMGSFLHPDTLGREWPVAAAFALAGFGAAAFARKWIAHLYRQASERSYLRLPARERYTAWVVAHASLLALLMVDCVVEKEGLLKLARLKSSLLSLSGASQQTSEIIFFIAAMLVTLGYVGYSAVEGYFKGRRHVVLNHLQGVQEREYREALLKRRAQAEVQSALEAVSGVKAGTRRLEEVESRIAETAQPFDARIVEWEAKRLARQEELTVEQKRRIQDALDNLLGAQGMFNGELEVARERCEPTWGVWRRFLHFVWPSRLRRDRHKEQKQRV
jgi:hypothetical protein